MTRGRSTSAGLALALLTCALLLPTAGARGAAVILNEYNAVGNDDWLEAPPPFGTKEDPFWQRRQGNGGDWFELVVISDLLDMRGWQIKVTNETGNPFDEASYRITLSNALIWSSLRSGTILTFSERLVNNQEDYEPVVGLWWLNARASNETAGTFVTIECIDPNCPAGTADWAVSNGNSQIEVKDPNGAIVFGPAGEGIFPASGVGNNEVFKLEANPTASILTTSPSYNDGTSSSFGQPNVWSVSGSPVSQDLSALRSVIPYSPLTTVRINEVFSHSDAPDVDWVELHNTTGSPIDIGGWYLSDSFNNLKEYLIPGGTTISANGYLVFDQNVLPFGFSSPCGDEVVLSVASGGVLSGARDWARFASVETGTSFGRPPSGSGRFVRLAAASEGSANAAPAIGPVVISELMYQPDPNDVTSVDPEFIELWNVSTSAVDLYTNFGASGSFGWSISGGVEYEFPSLTSMPAGSFLLVVNFDPATETELADFRATYGLDTSLPIFGPYSFSLSNFSDTVRLRMPDTPEPDPDLCGVGEGTGGVYVPRVIVDEVTYFDFGDWPSEPDGSGASLERQLPLGSGNEAASWAANLNGGASPGEVSSSAAPVPDLSRGALFALAFLLGAAGLGLTRRATASR